MSQKLRVLLLLSAQRALLGEVYPEVRAVFVASDSLKNLLVRVYLDKKPSHEDFEFAADVSSEICADIDFETATEDVIQLQGEIPEVDMHCVYMRKE